LALTDGDGVSGTTLDNVLTKTYNQQKSGIKPTVTMVSKTDRILGFTQNHKLGVFKGTIDETRRNTIEAKSFTQYYQINGSPGSYTFNKCTH